jgi:signal transduction histidine kinase/ActR/RegA family two-component response regulator
MLRHMEVNKLEPELQTTLINAMNALRRGDAGVRIPGHWPGVEGRLAEAFNGMAEHLTFDAARHQRLAAERIALAEARLAQANRRQDEFLAMLSHELRNPLAPIRNAIEVIRRFGPQDTKLAWATEVTDRQIRQLTRLLDELLDVARINQGKIVLRKEPLDLNALVVQTLETQRPAMAAREQVLTQALPSVPVWVRGDADRLQQVIDNLVDNAIKYTPKGGRLDLALRASATEAVFSLRDNGIGIEPELLPRIFDLFEQGHRTLDRAQGGLGVGLTLVQRLVRLHGGHVEVASAGPGQGAEFRVHLPCEAPMPVVADQPRALGAGNPGDRRILLVEDNPDVAETTAAMLTLAGHTVCIARDGLEALDYVSRFSPEVVLLDIGLPGMDGYEVARRLRAVPSAAAARLIALTGYGQSADRQRGREAGFDEHLLKPVDPALLADLIARAPALPEKARGLPVAGGHATRPCNGDPGPAVQ